MKKFNCFEELEEMRLVPATPDDEREIKRFLNEVLLSDDEYLAIDENNRVTYYEVWIADVKEVE